MSDLPTGILDTVICGDALGAMRGWPDNCVDAVVTDPPAGIAFMGKEWDKAHGGRDGWIAGMAEIAAEVLRVTKPGGHALVWALPRTSHWTATAWKNAGWEVRDRLAHLFGSGFPKSLDVSKAIDKAAGAERETVGKYELPDVADGLRHKGWDCSNTTKPGVFGVSGQRGITAPATAAAKQWQGWGTALKPACEDWWLLRKPLSEKTIAANVLKWGTGGLNVDGCRIEAMDSQLAEKYASVRNAPPRDNAIYGKDLRARSAGRIEPHLAGRWPANVILSHHPECRRVGTKRVKSGKAVRRYGNRGRGTFPVKITEGSADSTYASSDGTEQVEAWDCHPECAIRLLDEQSGTLTSGKAGAKEVQSKTAAFGGGRLSQANQIGDTGGASRFFYCAKASRAERNAGLEGMARKRGPVMSSRCSSCGKGRMDGRRDGPCCDNPQYEERPARGLVQNHHPTVKPLALMRYLCRLIAPPGGIIVDPFAGSGSTCIAALQDGFQFIGIEREAEYVEIARARIADARGPLWSQE